jgi:hypothetical protein
MGIHYPESGFTFITMLAFIRPIKAFKIQDRYTQNTPCSVILVKWNVRAVMSNEELKIISGKKKLKYGTCKQVLLPAGGEEEKDMR